MDTAEVGGNTQTIKACIKSLEKSNIFFPLSHVASFSVFTSFHFAVAAFQQ